MLIGNKQEQIFPLSFSFCHFVVSALLDYVCLTRLHADSGGRFGLQSIVESVPAIVSMMYPMIIVMIISKYVY